MDNALGIDVLLGAILLAGLLIGAKRGLFRSLIGLVITIVALVGAVVLADLAVDQVTDLVMPTVENAVVGRFTAYLDRAAGTEDADAYDDVSDLMQQYGVLGEARRKVMQKFREGVVEPFSEARNAAIETFRSAVTTTLRSVLRATVHTVLVLVLYAVLLLVLKLIAQGFDRLLDAPVLGAVNGFFGAVLGLAEAAFLICVLLQIAERLGVTFFRDHAADSHLLPYFLRQTPIQMLSALFHGA